MNVEYPIQLLIDNRESIKDDLKKRIPSAQLTNLVIGDYLFELTQEDGSKLPLLVIERKTITDYAASIRDGRHREQKKRILSNYPLHSVLYLVEGDLTHPSQMISTFNRVTKETIISSIMNTMMRDHMHVFHTSSTHETIDLLAMIHYKFQRQGNTFLQQPADPQASYQQDLIACAKTCKKENMTPAICFQMMLNCIPGVSTKVSTTLIQHFSTFAQMISILSALPTVEEKEAYILQLRLDNQRKMSKTTVKSIIEYLGFTSSTTTDQ